MSDRFQWKHLPIKTIGLIGLAAIFFLIIINLQQNKLKTLAEKKSAGDYEKEVKVEELKINLLKNLPSFGFGNLIADWSLLQFVQYFGDDEARRVTGYRLSPDYLDVIVRKDPRFVRSYLLISPASSINAGRPDRTISLMNEGLKSLSPTFKDSYFIWLYKAIDELLFKGDVEAAKNSYQKAADWAKIAGNTFIEQSARQSVEFLKRNPKSKAPQVGAWMLVWINTWDPQTRKYAEDNIKRLGGQLIVHPNGRVDAIPPKED